MISSQSMEVDSMPKVSHIIISYNQHEYIDDAIRSAVEQDYANLEVIVSDDASTDGTAELISKWKALYPDRIKAVLNKNNSGITGNSNHALRACTGDFISFQGGDDILLQGKITAQVNWFMADGRRDLCGHLMEIFYQDGSRLPHVFNPIKFRHGNGPVELIKHGCPYGGTSVMVRASKIPSHGFDQSVYAASDLLCWVEVLMSGGSYGYIEHVYARYRRHDANITNNPIKTLEDSKYTYKAIADRYPQYRTLANKMLVEHYIYYGGVCYLKAGKRKEAKSRFIEALRRRPFYLKAWVRLLQTL